MHKLVILDEGDAMTESAQQALRMIMTEYSSTTRFAIACNDSSKIIEPIQSRCAIVRFTKLNDEEVLERLKFVLDKEYTSKNRNELEYIHKNRIPLADIIKNNQMPMMSFNNVLGGLQVNSSGQLEERMRAVETAILDLPNRMPQTSMNVDSRGLSIKMTEISAKEKSWKR